MIGRLLVTGSAGLLGSNLILAARSRFEVVAAQREPVVTFPNVDTVGLDITDAGAVAEVVASARPTVVIHCAAATRVDDCGADPDHAHRVNVEGTAHVARAAAGVGARVLYVSTDMVFDGTRGGYSEEDAPRPVNIYGRTKLAGEDMVRSETPNHVIVRTNLFGWSSGPRDSLAEWVLGRLRRGDTVPGFEDVICSPVLVNDLVEVLLELIMRDARGVFHVGARQKISKFEFARALAREFGLPSDLVYPVSVAAAGLRAVRPRRMDLDPAKTERLLGRSMPTVQEGLRRFRDLEAEGYAASLKALHARAAVGGCVTGNGRP